MYKLEVYLCSDDFDMYNPRELDDELQTIMLCFHPRYTLGDKHDIMSSDFNSWKQLEEHIITKYGPAVITNLYLYDHSGLSVSTAPFGCKWDSSQIGFVLVTSETAERFNMSVEDVKNVIERDVKNYDAYLSGSIYGYRVYKEEKCKECGQITTTELITIEGFLSTGTKEELLLRIKDNMPEAYKYLMDEFIKENKEIS